MQYFTQSVSVNLKEDFMREGRMFFDSFIWHEIIFFLQYFPRTSFPITQCFPFIISLLCAPSLPIFYYSAMMLFFLKSLGKIDKLLLSSFPCVTHSSHFLSSQITLFGFLRILSHENAVAHCHHLVTPNCVV